MLLPCPGLLQSGYGVLVFALTAFRKISRTMGGNRHRWPLTGDSVGRSICKDVQGISSFYPGSAFQQMSDPSSVDAADPPRGRRPSLGSSEAF
ncbi:hypothetical protein R1flu_019808 [Riccia fluitans]|uniref:Uncharacterized protein n=1 Tax=Riccia fluitans TaxID=41844 RepID=A0ABD1ZL47_9MARC